MKKLLLTSPVDQIIIELLSVSPYRTTELLDRVQALYTISKQGFYDALRRLKKAQILLINKKQVTLNNLWIESLVEFTRNAAQTYHEAYRLESKYLDLQPGERVSYSFNSIEEADIFWNHSMLLLIKKFDKKTPIAVYNPHQWFIMARREAESLIWTRLADEGALMLCLVAGTSKLDKVSVARMNALHIGIRSSVTDKELLPKTRYVNIYNDIIVEMKIPLAIAERIDQWFATGSERPESIKELQDIIQDTARIKFTFSNSPNRARKLRKQIEKHFVIPKEYREDKQ